MKLPQPSRPFTKKIAIIASVAGVVGLASLAGIVTATSMTVSADTIKEKVERTSLVDKIAERFNLNKDDVQKVVDETKTEHQARHQQKLEDRLAKAVENGKITETQKAAITAKYQELRQYQASIVDKPVKEQRQLMETKFDEVTTWARDNGLGQYVTMLHFFRGGWVKE